jgi:spermidine synthase
MQQKNATAPALFALGFLSIGTQIYLLREFMMVFNDNELIIGLVLATWMLITGIGAYTGRFSWFLEKRTGILVFLLLVTGLMPPFMVAGLGYLKFLLVPYGSMADLFQTGMACTLVQLPFCLLNGFLFSFLSISSSENSPGRSYAWESLGSLASGALVNFIFLWFLGPFRGLWILTGIYLLLIIYYLRGRVDNGKLFWLLTFSTIYLVLSGIFDFRDLTGRILFPGQHIISNTETPYGQVVVTKNENQFNFFENGMLLFSSGNEMSNEENVHYALVQQPDPANVLLISGGFSGTLDEILKYHPKRIDYVELNPSLIEIASRHTRQLDDPCIHVYAADARRFIRKTNALYDVVLVNLPPPSTLQINRYYSLEFIKEIRQKMKPGAVIAYSLPASGDYVSKQGGRLNAVLFNTLKLCFSGVLIIPAGRNYFIASDGKLSLDIPGLIRARGVETRYVNRYYIETAQLTERSAYVANNLARYPARSGYINSDFTPLATWHQLSWWLSHDYTSYAFILIISLMIMVLLLITLNPVSAGLFAGGFTLATIEIILIVGLQVLSGYLFRMIGVIIMIFMLGLAAGSYTQKKIPPIKILKLYRWLQILLALCAFIIPVIIHRMSHAVKGEWQINLVFALFAFITAFIVGMEYRLASLLSHKTPLRTVAGNYSADMFGSAAGAFAATLFLIPSFGIIYTGLFLAALNLATTGLLWRAPGKIIVN